MNEKYVTKKNRENFESWYINKFVKIETDLNDFEISKNIESFYKTDIFEMRLGVYLLFYKEKYNRTFGVSKYNVEIILKAEDELVNNSLK